jgi:hypothetical protein
MIFASHHLLQLVKGRGFNSHSVQLFAGVVYSGDIPRRCYDRNLFLAISYDYSTTIWPSNNFWRVLDRWCSWKWSLCSGAKPPSGGRYWLQILVEHHAFLWQAFPIYKQVFTEILSQESKSVKNYRCWGMYTMSASEKPMQSSIMHRAHARQASSCHKKYVMLACVIWCGLQPNPCLTQWSEKCAHGSRSACLAPDANHQRTMT